MSEQQKTILVTGGAGFIGSAVIRKIINDTPHTVINLDKLTYAGNLESLATVSDSSRYQFEQADICDSAALKKVFTKYQPDLVMHLAAESHVDRSITGSADFVQTNIVGTYTLLETVRGYLDNYPEKCERFRFHHISTDEVYGDLPHPDDEAATAQALFTETTAYAPSSPYSATKAGSDHLVRAWHRTYGLPVIVTNCSNNYGPYQFPEKLIPHVILSALAGNPIPVYGQGQQIRDWLFVEDHADALLQVLLEGHIGETYNIGGHNEWRNIDVVRKICEHLEELVPDNPYSLQSGNEAGFKGLITYVIDRLGHDKRYAIDASKIERELHWRPKETFDSGLRKTIQWYVQNQDWCEHVISRNIELESAS